MSKYEYTMGKDLDLKAEQAATLATPGMSANLILKAMYLTMDLIYGFARTLPKFKVIEILARYPYWAWENGSYLRITRDYCKKGHREVSQAQTSLRHIEMGRHSQDNEQWHLMLIEDLMRQQDIRQGWLFGQFLPRVMAWKYMMLTRMMYRLNPAWSFAMNARFESHAEHQYMLLVQEHPEWEDKPIETQAFEYYPRQATWADLFRRVGLDERDHMNESREEYERLTGRALE